MVLFSQVLMSCRLEQKPPQSDLGKTAGKVSEPCCEKTCLWGFRPGLILTGLYGHRRWLEA